MSPDEQLEWEARAGRFAAAGAILSALFLLAGSLLYPLAFGASQPDLFAKVLIQWNDKPADFWVPTVLQTLGYLLLPIPLYYLYRVVKARRAELPNVARYVCIGGPLAVATAFVVHQVAIFNAATEFADRHGPTTLGRSAGGLATSIVPVLNTEVAAEAKFNDANTQPIVIALQWAGGLAVAFAFVLLGLNAMRAGVLSRFMGYVGVIVGALTVIPLFPVPIVAVFWLGALGALFLDRWPNGRGPAWSVVEEIPWPSPSQLAREAEPDDYTEEAYDDEDDDGDEPEPVASQQHPRSKKRKRKRRR